MTERITREWQDARRGLSPAYWILAATREAAQRNLHYNERAYECALMVRFFDPFRCV